MAPRRQPPRIERVADSMWTRYRRTRNWLVFLVTLGAGTAGAWVYAEPYIPAHRAMVRDVQSIVVHRVILAQLGVNREQRERLIEESKKRELELQSPEASATPQYKAIVQDRIDRVKSELKQLDDNDKTLFDEQKSKTR